MPDVTGSRFLKMAASKPEVLISQLPDKISTPIQRLTPIFGVLDINGTNMYTVRHNLVWMLRYKYLLDPENGGLAVGTALISCLEAEI